MAEVAAIRTYLREDLRVGGPNANDNPRVQSLMEERLNTWDSFRDFKKNDIEDLVKYLRRSGGADGNGVQIPAIAMKRMKIACYAAKYYNMVGRVIARESMAWTRIHHFETLIQIESEY